MPNRIDTKEIAPRRVRLLTGAALLSGVLVAGCGGSSPSPTTATVAAATAPASSVSSSRSAARSAGGSELAFASCMRADGVSNFPDPKAGRIALPAGTSPTAPAFRAAQAKCQKLLPNGALPGSGPPPSSQTMGKLVRIARCMRQHGVPGFPDPRTTVPSNRAGITVITDFDGAILLFPSTINMQAPAYRQALTACGAPPLGLPH